MTKVTYYMYSCDTCCMNREMMEMDGLDSVKCQKSKRRNTMGIFGMFNEEKDKKPNSDLLLQKLKEQNVQRGWRDAVGAGSRF